VVSASADCSDGFGYNDFAISLFGSDTPEEADDAA
jgi:hypothetical protein